LLTYEEFVRDQQAFLDKLTQFIGIENPGVPLRSENATVLGPTGMEVSRLLNHLFRSNLNHGGMLPSPLLNNSANGRRRLRPVSVLHEKWPGRRPTGRNGPLFEVGQEILDMVKEDNVGLDHCYGLGLDLYGYY
ncbi:MAG: hypothetical protein MI754_06180, partial [Chromatiales bacterium]|nr:hypothetical protein [Chromatiales bacterium]